MLREWGIIRRRRGAHDEVNTKHGNKFEMHSVTAGNVLEMKCLGNGVGYLEILLIWIL
jgi:hypothetical protein